MRTPAKHRRKTMRELATGEQVSERAESARPSQAASARAVSTSDPLHTTISSTAGYLSERSGSGARKNFVPDPFRCSRCHNEKLCLDGDSSLSMTRIRRPAFFQQIFFFCTSTRFGQLFLCSPEHLNSRVATLRNSQKKTFVPLLGNKIRGNPRRLFVASTVNQTQNTSHYANRDESRSE